MGLRASVSLLLLGIGGWVADAAGNVIVADAQADEVDVARRLDARGRIVRAGHTDGRRRG